MKLSGAGPNTHLTYCTNIHRGESWQDIQRALARSLPKVKQSASPLQDMGVGLRLSALASAELGSGEGLKDFAAFLEENGLYVFTINGFPYGPFHGQRVKEEVYQPDWRFAERLTYTNRLADQLAALLPKDNAIEGSISTVPATFRPIGANAQALELICENLLAHIAHLVRLKETTGRTITLALEPEPMCFLETSGELIAFLNQRFFASVGVRRFSALTGLSQSAAERALRQHMGICYDVCHAAVEFEEARSSILSLKKAGIGIFKLQLSAAIKCRNLTAEHATRLRRFDDGVYLHQVVERNRDHKLTRFLDLGPALATIEEAKGSEWRIHCHVPIFMDQLRGLESTQDFLKEILALHLIEPISAHLEVETYTFDVLPDDLRALDMETAIARELNWVKAQLTP